MGKTINIGVSNVARKGKAGWIGVANVARKVKKAWIGVAGIARLFFNTIGTLTYYGVASSSLVVARYNFASASAGGKYALFAGGERSDSSAVYGYVDVYDASLTRTTHGSGLSQSRKCLAGASVGDYAVFAGGSTNFNDYGSTVTKVDAFNSSLVRSNPTVLSVARQKFSAGTVGDYAVFAGGEKWYCGYCNTVDAYNSSLTLTSGLTLSANKSQHASASVGNYVLFGGGYNNSTLASVEAFDSSLTRVSVDGLNCAGWGVSGADNGEYALFVGGAGGDNSTTATAYNKSLTKVSAPSTSANVLSAYNGCGGSLNGYAVFPAQSSKIAFVYDQSLTLSTYTMDYNCVHNGAIAGEYLLFSQGTTSTSNTSVFHLKN